MLNLADLEQKLGNALEKETQETLSNWLLEKRSNLDHSLLTNGKIELKKVISFDYKMSNVKSNSFYGHFNSTDAVLVNNTDYKLAA